MHLDRSIADGMNKMQFAGMQHQARRQFGAWQQATPVQIASQNRVARQLTVNA